ncbi:hypothetical protein FDK12_07130 [Arthrobacter sp. NamB2]|uniref:DUF6318 family protein n=1 Tax=Arthrobacter sp. NamB2 TaxID=2576035 RepID=UPI0010C952EA|nr:DUF6318 family protein [Arthrobacter sp. NamB2]TKV28432.1 hypothetical protein FDK12_07130 [Arthrobacter sp. NamB2]
MNISRTAATAALTLLALTACAGTPEATPATSADTKPSPASSSAPAVNIQAPATNDLVGEATPEGARAFLYYYFELKSYVLQTGDSAALLQHTDGAAAEQAEAERLQALYDDGGWVLGGQPKVENVYLITPEEEVSEGADVTAVVPVNPDAYTEFAEDGSISEQRPFSPAGTIYTATIRYSDGAWKIASLEETPDAELPEA